MQQIEINKDNSTPEKAGWRKIQEEISKLVEDVQLQIIDGYSSLLVLGITGSGKSTFLSGLEGYGLKCVDYNGIICLQNKEKGTQKTKFLIGKRGSQTRQITSALIEIPLSQDEINNRIKDKIIKTDNYLISKLCNGKQEEYDELLKNHQNIKSELLACYDAPGFFDTDGTEQDLRNSAIIKFLLQHSRNIKIIVVISFFDIVGGRGSHVNKILTKLMETLPEIEYKSNSIGILITRCPKRYTKQNAQLQLSITFEKNQKLVQFLQKIHENGNIALFHAPDELFPNDELPSNFFLDAQELVKKLEVTNFERVTTILQGDTKAEVLQEISLNINQIKESYDQIHKQIEMQDFPQSLDDLLKIFESFNQFLKKINEQNYSKLAKQNFTFLLQPTLTAIQNIVTFLCENKAISSCISQKEKIFECIENLKILNTICDLSLKDNQSLQIIENLMQNDVKAYKENLVNAIEKIKYEQLTQSYQVKLQNMQSNLEEMKKKQSNEQKVIYIYKTEYIHQPQVEQKEQKEEEEKKNQVEQKEQKEEEDKKNIDNQKQQQQLMGYAQHASSSGGSPKGPSFIMKIIKGVANSIRNFLL